MTSPADSDRIILTGLAFYGYHGALEAEATLGQRFHIDLELGLDLGEAARSDDLHATVSYADVHEAVKEAFEERRFKLIEALAHHIMTRLFTEFPRLDWVRVRVRKPEAPLPIVAGTAAVELLRRRSEV